MPIVSLYETVSKCTVPANRASISTITPVQYSYYYIFHDDRATLRVRIRNRCHASIAVIRSSIHSAISSTRRLVARRQPTQVGFVHETAK